MKLHLVALPHTQVSSTFCSCAYTSKVLKFCRMMRETNEIFVYAPKGPMIRGATLVPCLTNAKRVSTFGVDDSNRLPEWPTNEQTKSFNQKVIKELRKRLEPHDLILLSGGWTHKSIADAFPGHICCEPGVGYEGILTNFCAFESYAWQHYVYGKKGLQGRWFDVVIPNYFDPDEFPTMSIGKGEYLLFLGRLIENKGYRIAIELAEATGIPLLVAGARGDQEIPDNVNHVGPVNVNERACLLAGAKALIAPTYYVEPFGGVAVEAMMCGTPVISSDWGAFTETVQNGVSGYRFRTFAEAIWAVGQLDKLNPETIRNYALSRYSLSAVRPQFETWFNRLNSLWKDGWYTKQAA